MVWTGELVSLFISYPITEKRVRNDDFGGCPQDLCALRLVVIIKKEVEWEVESVKSYMKLFIESANVMLISPSIIIFFIKFLLLQNISYSQAI